MSPITTDAPTTTDLLSNTTTARHEVAEVQNCLYVMLQDLKAEADTYGPAPISLDLHERTNAAEAAHKAAQDTGKALTVLHRNLMTVLGYEASKRCSCGEGEACSSPTCSGTPRRDVEAKYAVYAVIFEHHAMFGNSPVKVEIPNEIRQALNEYLRDLPLGQEPDPKMFSLPAGLKVRFERL